MLQPAFLGHRNGQRRHVDTEHVQSLFLEITRMPAGIAAYVEHPPVRMALERRPNERRPKRRFPEVLRGTAREREVPIRAFDDLDRIRTVGMIPDGVAESVLSVL
jgi:hypothetical protein